MSSFEEATIVCTDANEETSGDEPCESDEIHRHLKRQLSIHETVPFIQKKPTKLGALVPINALTQLYDIKRWVQFKLVSRTESIFTMSVDVNGQTFTGKGLSKKKARLNAAEQVVKSLLRLPSTDDADKPNGRKIPNADLTSEVCVLFDELQKGPDEDKPNVRDGKMTKSGDAECDMQGCYNPRISDAENVPSINVKQTTNESTVPENALDHLSHLKVHVRFQFVSQTEPIFTMSVEINGQTFIGQGPSKKKAKLDAAEQVLRSFAKLPNAEEANQAICQEIPNVGFTPNLAESGFNVFSNHLQDSRVEEQIDVSRNSTISPKNSNRFSRCMTKESKQPDCTISVKSLNELRTNLKSEILSEIMESPDSLCLSGSNYGVKSEIHEDASEVPQVLVDLVSRLVDEKIASLTCGFQRQNAVLAGIRARGYEVYSTSHICVATDAKVDSH